MTLLEARRVRRDFVSGDGTVTALQPVSLALAEGGFIAITGPSGSGKSTLLNLLSGLDRPSGGEVWFQGRALSGLCTDELARLRNSAFGFIFQTPHLLPHKTVLENVALPFHYAPSTPWAEVRGHCLSLLDYVGLGRFARRYPNTLSGGELQRVVFARALVRGPRIIFADEPTGSLDADNSRRLLELLADQVRQGTSVLMVSHDAEAVTFADTEFRLDKFHGMSNA